MVYCTKCGTKNNPTEKYCAKCGTPLEMSTKKTWEKQIEDGAEEFGRRAEKWGQEFGRQAEEDCFGLAKNTALIGLVIGIFIVIAGILLLIGIQFLRIFWPIILLTFGILILIAAIKTLTKKPNNLH